MLNGSNCDRKSQLFGSLTEMLNLADFDDAKPLFLVKIKFLCSFKNIFRDY